MRIVTPVIIGDAELTSTTATNEYADWAAGTFNTGDRVVNDRVVWEALADAVTSEPSTLVPTDWLRVGFSNRWRMFTEGRDSVTTDVGLLEVELLPLKVVSTVGLLGITGASASVVMTDGTEGVVYDKTVSLVDIGVADHWSWHFLAYEFDETAIFQGLPPYQNATTTISVDGGVITDPVGCGRVVIGPEIDIGATQYGTSVEVLDYSTKERDPFGNLTLIPRRTITLVDFDVTIESARVDFTLRQLRKIAALPALFIGDVETYRSAIVFGIYRSAVQGIDTPSVSDLTLQVEEF